MATAGSFCLLLENGPLGLPVLTRRVARVGQYGVGGCPGLGADDGGENQTGEDGYGAEPKDGLHSASMRVSWGAARFATVGMGQGGESR